MPEKNYCDVPLCGRELTAGCGSKGGAMICGRCKGARYTARKNGEGWLVSRAEQLHFLQERIDYLAPIVAKNAKRVQQQLAAMHEESERLMAERLRSAKRAIAKAEKASAREMH